VSSTDPSPPLSRISPARLFVLLILFVCACAYAIFHSARFQRESRALIVRIASSALDRHVSFSDLGLSILPPGVTVRNVRIDGAAGENRPFFQADEVSVSGQISWIGRTLTLGSISASHPQLHVAVFPDGSDNLPRGLKSKAGRSAVRVEVERIAVTGGTFFFNELRLPLDLAMRSFVAELNSIGQRNRFQGRLNCRRAELRLRNEVSVPFAVDGRFELGGGRLSVESLTLSGAFGILHAIGEIPRLSQPVVAASVSGELDAFEVESAFRVKLPFRGIANVLFDLTAGSGAGFRLGGRVEVPKLRAEGFEFDALTATVSASASGLTARIERANFEGGSISGIFRLGRFSASPQQFELLVEGERLSVERFFADIGLPGTRIASVARATLALRWTGSDLDRGDGGGEFSLSPVEAGPQAVALSGGGPIAIRNGFIDFENAELRFPDSALSLNGGFAIGDWNPRLQFSVDSRDFRSVDRLATNFTSAIDRRPVLPYGLAGSGRIIGSLRGRWAMPEVAASLSAENASYAGVRLGTVYSNLSVADQAFVFHPLRAYDGDSRLTLTGYARYASKPGSPSFDLTAEAFRFPIERALKYLSLDFPVTGRATGTLPVSGTPAAVTGGGDVVLEDAVVYGQPIARLTGTLALTPGAVELQNIRGQIDDSRFGGEGRYAFASGRYRFRIAGDDLPVSRIAALAPVHDVADGLVSFRADGEGTLDHPSLSATIRTKQFSLYGHPVAAENAPAISAVLDRGTLRLDAAAPGRWSISAAGPISGDRPELHVSFEVTDPSVLPALLPDLPSGFRGELAASGVVRLDPRDDSILESKLTVSRLRLATGEKAAVEEAGPIEVSYAKGRVSIANARLVALPRTSLSISLSVGVAKPQTIEGTLRGEVDPALLAGFAGVDAETSGQLSADLGLSGTLSRPLLRGRITLDRGRFRAGFSPYVLEDISARIAWNGAQATIEAFRSRVGGGEIVASGDAQLSGYALKDYRLIVQAQNVTVRSIEGLSLQADADFTVVGDSDRSVVRGQATLLSGTYTKDFAPTLATFFSPSRNVSYSGGRKSWQDRTSLEVQILSSASLEVRNNLARLTASVDLLARGTLAEPILLGQIGIDEGGKITFQDVKYEIQSGTITFGNFLRTEPVVDINATADVKGYSVNVQAVGTLGGRSRVQFSLSSDPPLSQEQLTALLLTGAAPETARAQASTTSSIAGSLAGFAIRPVTSRVQQLFRLDRFQIDPVLQSSAGSSGGAVITVGKNLSRDLSVTYSYSAEANAQSIILVEYQIDANKLLQASKDENNVYSIDIKFRKRF
jgi:translocation and assembly module TamB